MKPYNLILVLITLLSLSELNAQPTDREIDRISSQLVSILNGNRKVKRVAVANFTFRGNQHTSIGKYLADELSLGLAMRGPKFEIIPRETVKEAMYQEQTSAQDKMDMDRLSDHAGDALIKDDFETETQQKKDVVQATSTLLNEFSKLGAGNGLKNSDAIISGTIEDRGDELRVIIEVSRKNAMIGGARGNFVKTPDIRDMLNTNTTSRRPSAQPAVPTMMTTKPPGPQPTMSTGNSVTYKQGDLLIEVTGCHQNGKMLECKLNIVSSSDDDLTAYCNRTKIVDASNSHEFHAVEVKLADVSNSNRATKSLISDIPIQGLIRFGDVDQRVITIARMEINCYSRSARSSITAKLDNIAVR